MEVAPTRRKMRESASLAVAVTGVVAPLVAGVSVTLVSKGSCQRGPVFQALKRFTVRWLVRTM